MSRSKAATWQPIKRDVDEISLSGAEIVERVAQDYSVNPRLLLAVIEKQSGWVTSKNPKREVRDYPIGWADPQRKGLYRQLIWAANNLNRGYYLWRVGGIGDLAAERWRRRPDQSDHQPRHGRRSASLFVCSTTRPNWEQSGLREGLFAVYNTLFGYPFDYAYRAARRRVICSSRRCSFHSRPGWIWSFTGGPHGGWGDGSALGGAGFWPARRSARLCAE